MARQQILYFHHGGTVGGAPLSLLFLLNQLDRQRYDPLVVFSADGPVVERYRATGIPVRVETGLTDFSHTELVWYGQGLLWMLPLKLFRFGPSVKTAQRIIAEIKPDLIHLNSSALAAPAIAAQRAGVPVVWHIREPLAHGYFGLRRAWLRRTINRCATRVIAISHYDASQLLPSPNVRVIYNFVNFTEFDRSLPSDPAREKLGLTPAQNVVTMLGGTSAVKGTLPFVQAYELVRQHLPNTRFLIAGGSPQVGDRRAWASTAKLLLRQDAYDRAVMRAASAYIAKQSLRFLGVRQDIPQILAASDVLVFPATVPHFARPIIEAGAMGKPVVASDLGGPRELVTPGETGLLVPPNNPQALAEALIEILSDPALAQRMGQAAYTQATQKFEAQTNAQATFAIYNEVL